MYLMSGIAPTNDTPTLIGNKQYNKTAQAKQHYALTVTFKHLVRRSPLGQFNETAPYICKLMSRSTEFKLVPEWRTQTGDIHYHGSFKITDQIKWLKQTLPSLKSLGFVCVKPCPPDNEVDNKWVKYYTKEFDIAREIVPKHIKLPLSGPIIQTKKKEEPEKESPPGGAPIV